MKQLIGLAGLACVMLALSAVWGQSAPATRPAPLPADKMLDRMLSNTGGSPRPLQPLPDPPAQDRTTGKGAIAPDAPAMNLIREGTYLVDRVGRLKASSDGQQMEFVFDSDAKAMGDPPVIILPNLKLMAMEKATSSASRDLRFRITAMVTEYHGRNYVLLEKFVVVADNG